MITLACKDMLKVKFYATLKNKGILMHFYLAMHTVFNNIRNCAKP